jgi:glycosyltransferase involved in cell wall biosynthesis
MFGAAHATTSEFLTMPLLTFAFCTYNRADRLERLVAVMREQSCPVPFEILAINNNSPDNTLDVLAHLQRQPGTPLRVVTEMAPGIVPARNRALAETLDRDILVFIDDDELPQPGLLDAAYDAIVNEGAECAGGRVEMDFSIIGRPAWLGDELLGFLAAVDHGSEAFWIKSIDTPIWTANVAYNMRLFRNNPVLRFDARYNREGTDIGGGEDVMMLRALLEHGTRIRYRPEMAVLHAVEAWRLHRRYFLKLHYLAGIRKRHELPAYERALFGVPPFLFAQFARHLSRAIAMYILNKPGKLRQMMNATHALGLIKGCTMRNNSR